MAGKKLGRVASPGAKDASEQLEKHLACPRQAWLFGAGISKNGGVPLISVLTTVVIARMQKSKSRQLLEDLRSELPDTAHVEQLLTRISDHIALAEGARSQKTTLQKREFDAAALRALHVEVVTQIAEVVRWGHFPTDGSTPERNGSIGNSIVDLSEHSAFVRAVFDSNQAGLQDRRGPVWFFTLNYDTLLEDALALHRVAFWDGFVGGAVAFRSHRFGEREPSTGFRAHVVKLHGSIDWYATDDGKVWRVRDGDRYPERKGRVLIYPQATKYVATQLDPFAAQFELLRRTLSTTDDNVLAVCGYSFGDEHVNQEIELALSRPESKTTLLVFCREGGGLPNALQEWRKSTWGRRLYIATERALYAGPGKPVVEAPGKTPLSWWTFSGMTELLMNGCQEDRS